MKLIFGHDEALAQWAASRISGMTKDGFGPCRAIGVAAGDTIDSELYAAVVYHGFVDSENWRIMHISIAARSPAWAAKGVIRALLSVPFEQYQINKLYSIMSAKNTRAIRFNEALGFKRETFLRHHFGQDHHGVVTYMLRPTYFLRYGGGRVQIGKKSGLLLLEQAA